MQYTIVNPDLLSHLHFLRWDEMTASGTEKKGAQGDELKKKKAKKSVNSKDVDSSASTAHSGGKKSHAHKNAKRTSPSEENTAVFPIFDHTIIASAVRLINKHEATPMNTKRSHEKSSAKTKESKDDNNSQGGSQATKAAGKKGKKSKKSKKSKSKSDSSKGIGTLVGAISMDGLIEALKNSTMFQHDSGTGSPSGTSHSSTSTDTCGAN
jgi:hypothetical protein